MARQAAALLRRGTTDVEGAGAGAQISVEIRPRGENGTLPLNPKRRRPGGAAGGSPHWSRHEVAIDVPEAAHTITLGLALLGNGAAWLGDLGLAAE